MKIQKIIKKIIFAFFYKKSNLKNKKKAILKNVILWRFERL